jgi:hypothetical protein
MHLLEKMTNDVIVEQRKNPTYSLSINLMKNFATLDVIYVMVSSRTLLFEACQSLTTESRVRKLR